MQNFSKTLDDKYQKLCVLKLIFHFWLILTFLHSIQIIISLAFLSLEFRNLDSYSMFILVRNSELTLANRPSWTFPACSLATPRFLNIRRRIFVLRNMNWTSLLILMSLCCAGRTRYNLRSQIWRVSSLVQNSSSKVPNFHRYYYIQQWHIG